MEAKKALFFPGVKVRPKNLGRSTVEGCPLKFKPWIPRQPDQMIKRLSRFTKWYRKKMSECSFLQRVQKFDEAKEGPGPDNCLAQTEPFGAR